MIGSVSLVSRSARTRSFLLIAILATVFGLLSLAAARADAASYPGNYTMVVDQGGANDVNASQVDLTQFGRDNSDPNRFKLLWSWDATDDWTGTGATGDACALFDTATATAGSTSPCARRSRTRAGTRTSSCRWSGSPLRVHVQQRAHRPLRSAGSGHASRPARWIAARSTCSPASISAESDGEPDHADGPVPEPDPGSELAERLDDRDQHREEHPAGDAVLVNVCTYPSAGNGGNNNPFDCIINPGDGLLVIKKITTVPTSQAFDFTRANPAVNRSFQIVGTGQTPQIGLAPTSIVSVGRSRAGSAGRWTPRVACSRAADRRAPRAGPRSSGITSRRA